MHTTCLCMSVLLVACAPSPPPVEQVLHTYIRYYSGSLRHHNNMRLIPNHRRYSRVAAHSTNLICMIYLYVCKLLCRLTVWTADPDGSLVHVKPRLNQWPLPRVQSSTPCLKLLSCPTVGGNLFAFFFFVFFHFCFFSLLFFTTEYCCFFSLLTFGATLYAVRCCASLFPRCASYPYCTELAIASWAERDLRGFSRCHRLLKVGSILLLKSTAASTHSSSCCWFPIRGLCNIMLQNQHNKQQQHHYYYNTCVWYHPVRFVRRQRLYSSRRSGGAASIAW